MKIRCTIWFVVISVIFIRTASGQAFVNLDFESATLVPVPGDRYHTVQFAQAFPGWTKTMVGAIDTNALYEKGPGAHIRIMPDHWSSAHRSQVQ
jgi:hypothetical protein